MSGSRRLAALSALALLLVLPGVARSQSTFANPVLPGDYPDPTIVKAGSTFYASATSASWAPIFPVFRSRDLVRWERVGAVLQGAPKWANGNFWAPELVRWAGRFYAFYSASRKGGRPCIGVAVAARGEGPWTDKGPVLCRPGGTIDVDPVTNTDGTRWLVFKHMGPGGGISAIRFSPLRMKAVGHEYPLIAPDAPWEELVTEGPDVVVRGGSFYLFYAGGHCCRPPCTYAEGVARAPSLLGPYVKDPNNPLMTGNDAFKCPGHGTTVDLGAQGLYLLHHAYDASDALDGRRSGLLDRIDFDGDGWPQIAGGQGPARSGPAPLGAAEAPTGAGFTDGFDGGGLLPGWEWPWQAPPAVAVDRGVARFTCRGGNRAVSYMARQVPADRFSAKTVIVPGRRGGPAIGLSAHGPGHLLRGIELRDGAVRAFRDQSGALTFGPKAPAPAGPRPELLISATPDGTVALYASGDGRAFAPIDPGPAAAGAGPPPRVAIRCRGRGSAGVTLTRVVPQQG
ncbi:MAG: glycoside hydrolase family 43 protein [Solirubrobacteraceae bacterium]